MLRDRMQRWPETHREIMPRACALRVRVLLMPALRRLLTMPSTPTPLVAALDAHVADAALSALRVCKT